MTTMEALKELVQAERKRRKEDHAPGSFIGDYCAQKRAQARQGHNPLPFAERFTFAAFDFLPDPDEWRNPFTPKWKPTHPLAVPPPRLRKESNAGDEIDFAGDESIFLTRAEVLAAVAKHNRAILADIASGKEEDEFYWLIAIELCAPKAAMHFANVDWDCGTWGIANLLLEIVKPTAAELAEFGKVVTP